MNIQCKKNKLLSPFLICTKPRGKMLPRNDHRHGINMQPTDSTHKNKLHNQFSSPKTSPSTTELVDKKIGQSSERRPQIPIRRPITCICQCAHLCAYVCAYFYVTHLVVTLFINRCLLYGRKIRFIVQEMGMLSQRKFVPWLVLTVAHRSSILSTHCQIDSSLERFL